MRFISLVVVALCISFLVGCGGLPKTPAPVKIDANLVVAPVSHAQTDSAQAQAYIQAAEKMIQQLIAKAKAAGDQLEMGLLQAVSDDHVAASKSQVAVDAQLQIAQNDNVNLRKQYDTDIAIRDQTIVKWQQDYVTAQGKWYVKVGKFIDAAIIWICAIWALLGIASIVAGLSNPLSWVQTISSEIVHFIPVGNIFPWIENGIRAFFPSFFPKAVITVVPPTTPPKTT